MKLSRLIEPFGGRLVGPDAEIAVLTDDSRQVAPGAAFAAVRGAKDDGHRHIPDAAARGATAFIVEDASLVPAGAPCAVLPDTRRRVGPLAARFFGDPSRRMWVCGVTGTNGKTSTTYLGEAMFAAAGKKVGVIGTITYRYAGVETPAATTTPGPIEFQRLMREMVERGVEILLVEVSSHALDQFRADGAAFDCAVFTNLTRDHLDYHPDMDAYLAAKRRLFVPLLNDSPKPRRTAVVNSDDPAAEALIAGFAGEVLRFSTANHSRADLKASAIGVSPAGTRFVADGRGQGVTIQTPLIGAHNAANALQALAIGLAYGLDAKEAARGLATLASVPGRLERVPTTSGIHVFVDYSHTPDSLERALSVCRNLGSRRLITVFGCGGDRDRGKRPLMGEAAGRLADLVVLTSDNPRTEDPFAILAEIEPGVRRSGMGKLVEPAALAGERGYVVLENRREAIALAVQAAGRDDIILIAGKGHEDYQIYGTAKKHFDDREEAAAALAASRKGGER
ncbi:MAG: UDP-N-acetylmuramoyl-L-alanyl-D-glutamate--2,6-diaminopimelate ligase [Myxococcales bacterium]|nr:MAG: UDP-N-acetylmuramoyl-L-alanyl-D-glutamate--2,6-diaminopimelate ligase [Myxococcales bacterium]